jgi:Skp family chaperone for outer membrane proteins
MKEIDIFNTPERITINRVSIRLSAMRAVTDFTCETDKHREARMALYFNIDNYDRAIKVAQDMLEKPSDEIQVYNKEKSEIIKKHGGTERDLGDGRVSIEGISDREKYASDIAELDKKHAKVLKEDQDRQKRNNELLQMEIKKVPEPHYTSPDCFPDSITADKLAGISFMLKKK